MSNGVQPVRVNDVDMPFMSMVGFMVKWALASIPAMGILAIFWGIVLAFVSFFGFALFGSILMSIAQSAL